MLRRIDLPLLLLAMLLCSVGLVVIYSAGYDATAGRSYRFEKQAYSLIVGVVIFVGAALLSQNFWRRWAYAGYAGGTALLVVVLSMGIVGGGARRWILLGGFTLQPSELTKLALILVLARILSADNAPRDGYGLLDLWKPALVLAIPFLLVAKQPDLGTALCHALIAGVVLLVAGIRKTTLLALGAAGLAAAVPLWGTLKEYQKERVLNFMSPERDPLGTGYHAIQSKIAVGSGGVFGKGMFHGTQTQLRFLPEQTTDFIFSVLAEEWGFIGTALVFILYALLLIRIMFIAYRTDRPFGFFVAVGVAAMVFWQVVVNVGMTTGVLPVVGLTLPLVSYGGSSLVALMTGLGIVAGLGRGKESFSRRIS